jgi:ABC-type nickel/cobalt efflux system permease component RcnA
MIAAILAGLVAGVLHALSGPDHLAAVTPLSISADQRAWRIGVRWGLGHAIGVALIGAVLIPLRDLLDLDRFSWWSERLVGVMLIGLGLWGLKRATSKWFHSHRHEHEDDSHAHIHFHRPGHSAHGAESSVAHPHRHTHAAFVVGLLHGTAGATHLFGVLPALALPTLLAVVYLGGYGAGNLLAMGGFAWFVGWASVRLSDLGVRAYQIALGTCSAVAIAVGVAWLAV